MSPDKLVQRNSKKIEGAIHKGTRRALNRVGQQAFRLTMRSLAAATGLPQRKLKPYVSLNRADYINLEAIVRVLSHTFNIASFAGRQTKRGVSSSAWGKRRVYPGTFMVKGRTAFKRVGKARLPIKPVWGPRIHKEFANELVQDRLDALVQQNMPKTLSHEIDFALGRLGLKRG